MTNLLKADTAYQQRLVVKLITTFAMTLALVFLFTNYATAKTVYEITTENATYTAENSANVDDALDEVGVDVNATDLVASSNEKGNTVQVSVTHTQYATLTVDGSVSTVQLEEGDTVSDVLERLNVTMGKDDIISKDLNATVKDGDNLELNRVEISYYDVTEESSYDSYREADPNADRGTEYIKQAGVPGTTTYHHKVTVIDGGDPIDEVESTSTSDMVPEITAYGTRVSFPGLSGLSQSSDYITNIDDEQKTITTVSGNTYNFSSEDYFTCTAYSGGGSTSTGRAASIGVVAVDPSVVPYGTEMFVVSENGSIVYGTAVAGDCGGGINGKMLDLYFNSTSECMSFGRRSMKVYFLN